MDYADFYGRLAQLVAAGTPPGEGMLPLIDHAVRLLPGLDRDGLRAMPWATDAEEVRRWLTWIFRHEPPPASVDGLWFGLSTGVFDDGGLGTVLSVSGCPRLPAPRWFEGEMTWVPSEPDAPSSLLRSFAPDYDDEDAIVEQVVVQGYAALAVCAALRALPPGRPMAVAFGFSAGDVLLLGNLDATGWHGDLRLA